jgi:uncharacterized protein (TIGR03067 family)
MIKCSWVALAFWGASLLLGPVALQPGDDKGDDTKRLAGTWIIDPVTYKDAKDKDLRNELAAVRVIFEGDSLTLMHPPGNEEKGPFQLNPSTAPKQIDLFGDMGKLQAQGIYELEKDHLKLCWDRQFKTRGRPTKFAHGKDGDEPFLLVLVREQK